MINYGIGKKRAPRRDVISLPISPSVRQRCIENGYSTVEYLEDISDTELAQEASLTREEAAEVLKVSVSHDPEYRCEPLSARQLYDTECLNNFITTFSPELDQAMGGGVALGRITEFCGVPGIGKTQIGIQLCLSVQIPWEKGFDGVDGSALFIDAEGSFDTRRVAAMGDAMCKHLGKISMNNSKLQLNGISHDSLMSNIHYFRTKDISELIKLIVVDSIAFHFRQGFSDMTKRSRVLSGLAHQLTEIAENQNIAVVVTNQTMQRPEGNSISTIVPALSDNWAQCVNTRVCMFWENEQRTAIIQKAPHLENQCVPFWITQHGIGSIHQI